MRLVDDFHHHPSYSHDVLCSLHLRTGMAHSSSLVLEFESRYLVVSNAVTSRISVVWIGSSMGLGESTFLS
jgi:hypothetical protein